MRRLTSRRPTPSLVISLIALFFAMGGSSYALVVTGKSIRNNTVTGADVRNSSLASRDMKRDSVGGRAIKESTLGNVPRADGVDRQAVVTGAGLLARGRGIASVARTGVGRYQVIANRDVRGCVYVATVGDAGAAAPPTGGISTSALASNVSGVSIRTENENGGAADRPFHLIISC